MEDPRKKMVYRKEMGKLATFLPNKKDPVYNWFYYKEGFAKELVFDLIKRFGIKEGKIVLDPFCGSGTTLLACKQKGVDSIGFDVMPCAIFAARAKTNNYDVEELKKAYNIIFADKFTRPDTRNAPPILKKYFSKFAVEDLIFFREKIKRLDQKSNDFFLLCMINTAMKVSYAWKDGAVLKYKKRNAPPFSKLFRRNAARMIRDVKRFKTEKAHTFADFCDARKMGLSDKSVDFIITSPPYLNQIDYTKVYEIENYIVEGITMPGLRSYIGKSTEDYFIDMSHVLKEMYRVCKNGAKVAIVVGNAYVGDVIESDIKIAEIAQQIGFKLDEVVVLNERFALKNRTEKTGTLRESMIILEKVI